MEDRMTSLEIQVQNFFSRTDLDFISCRLCSKPLLRHTCEERQRRYGHYQIENNEEAETVALRFMACEGCDHFTQEPRKQGKLTIRERNQRMFGTQPRPENRLSQDQMNAMAEKVPRSPEMRALHGSSVFKSNKAAFDWRKKTKSKWGVK